MSNMVNQYTLQDPRMQYPQPPFEKQPLEKLKNFGIHVPPGRPDQPVELTSVYVFPASQESSYVTAEVYGVTGGHSTP